MLRKFFRRPTVLVMAALAALIIAAGSFAAIKLTAPRDAWKTVALTDLYQQVVDDAAHGRRDTVTLTSDHVAVGTTSGDLRSWIDGRTDVITQLRDQLQANSLPFNSVSIQYEKPAGDALKALSYLAIILVLVALLSILQKGQAFGRLRPLASRARRFQSKAPKTLMSEVAGVDEAKAELAEIVQFLKDPAEFTRLGARIPRGVLLAGPPGTGKTLLSRAIAGEAGVPFYSVSGSEFVEMFVGVGASRVRQLFTEARKHAPCIVFIDEIDAIGRKRGAGPGPAHEEREQTLNQILIEMDGFDVNTNVIVIAATNRIDVLDSALLRPGRFDRQVTLDPPDVRGREAILQVHARGKPLDASVRLASLARQTPGFSGADLSNVMNEAAILAARSRQPNISMRELEEAVDRVIAGPAKKSRIMSARERAITAYHESGHALVARSLPHCDPVTKVSIVARGRMGGYTRMVADEDRSYWSKSQLLDNLACLLGGQAAEELVFGECTTGASSDIERATQIARSIVCEYGMSADVGPVAFGDREQVLFKGNEASSRHNFGEATASAIDAAVYELVARAKAVAQETLSINRACLERIAQQLLALETLDEDAFEALYLDDGPVSTGDNAAPVNEPVSA